jgi:hypothetical protein
LQYLKTFYIDHEVWNKVKYKEDRKREGKIKENDMKD